MSMNNRFQNQFCTSFLPESIAMLPPFGAICRLDHPLLSGNGKCVFKPENIDGSYPRIMLNDNQFP
jgi:hypothetical protein